MAPTIQIVIVNWNAGQLLRRCLASFAAVSGDALKIENVVIVDNASTDDSLDELDCFADTLPIKIIRNEENRGFAAACNQGAAGSSAEFLLFLNPDVELRSGCLEQPGRFLAHASNQSVGVVGIQLLDAEGLVLRSCARQPAVWSLLGHSLALDRLMPSIFPPHFLLEWDHRETRPVDQVMGAFYFVRRSLFDALGGFDERFFVYFEDLDFAVRMRKQGWTSVYLATAQVFHLGCGTTRNIKARRLFYSARSRILYSLKHFGIAGATAVAMTTLLLEPLIRLAAASASLRFADVKDVAHGFGMLWAGLPNIISTHRQFAKLRSPHV
jgi:GT2 family glycosyltransferase